MLNRFKNYFIAGLIAILPLWISYYILLAVFNVAASLLKPFLRLIPFLAATPVLLDVLSFVGTIVFVISLGVVITNVFGQQMFSMFERRITKIPFLSGIYGAIRKLTDMFSQSAGSKNFQRVVLVEFPKPGSFIMGFLTSEGNEEFNQKTQNEMVTVFTPTAPNPTSGFLFVVPKTATIPLNISVEEAIKMLVSGGVTAGKT
jgi:uncharacterized membrane protein